MVRVGIVGATGYAGYELVKLCKRHPEVELGFLVSQSYTGQRYGDVYACPYDECLVSPEQADYRSVDVVFLCTPHKVSAPHAKRVLEAGAKCIDLSADLRLRDAEVYRQWYCEHPAPDLLPEAVYGLTEIYRERIRGARLVANPGCYPMGPLLSLYPWLHKGIVDGQRVIVDCKSGVSGAGATPSDATHFVNVHDNLSVYKVGRAHRHVPEIEQEWASYGGRPLRVVFTPHLLPVSRGILSTIYVEVDPAYDTKALIALWQETYAGEPFIQVLEDGKTATLAHAVNTNRCALSVSTAGAPGEFVVVTAIDNLLKGASGQAMQNMNVMFGLPETLGLL
ncbi:MAG: N-acetyl-gamma-glutamyl-phosphate reductase [Chloroflexi bacterium]|nr:N-acetyl-gamma-glutamyl-phosphate reductase [Chloroflexota bacterium]